MINEKFEPATSQVPPGIAVVTGTSRGIGKGVVERLLSDGFFVCGCSRGVSTISHGQYEHSIVDLSQEKQVENWLEGVLDQHGRLDLLICNAAISLPKQALLSTSADLHAVFQTNFFSSARLCSMSGKAMMRKRAGCIIVFSSIATTMVDAGTAAYASSKAALETYIKVLGRELSPFSVRCHVIRIPIVESDMTSSLSAATVQRVLDRVPAGRIATIDDVYNTIRFLNDPRSAYSTGTVFLLGEAG